MITVRIARNKMEEFMNDITGRLLQSKKKYFIVCEYRGVQYVDGTKDLEFLKKVANNLNSTIAETEEKKG